MENASGEREERFIRLGPGEGAEPVFFVYPGLDAPFCHDLTEALPGRPLYLLSRLELSPRGPIPTFEELARRHVETIRGVRPRGPYILGGFSAGAVLAREIAGQLEAQGEDVPDLLLVADARLSLWWWRAARGTAMLLPASDPAERLDRFNLLGRLGQLALDSCRRGGAARLREAIARARHRVQRQGSIWAAGPNSRSSDDTLKALLWAWAEHRARGPRWRVIRVEAERNENGMMKLDLESPGLLPTPCSTSPAESSSARLATPSRST